MASREWTMDGISMRKGMGQGELTPSWLQASSFTRPYTIDSVCVARYTAAVRASRLACAAYSRTISLCCRGQPPI